MKRPQINPFQMITHTLFMIGGWGFYIFALTQLKGVPENAYHTVMIVLGLEVIFLIVLTLSWIGHHLTLHRRFGPRKTITRATWTYERDWLDYQVKGDFNQLKQAKVIVVVCHDEKKLKTFEAQND